MTDGPSSGLLSPSWADSDPETWPWCPQGARILPVAAGRLEFAQAVRAHLERLRPEAIVVDIPRAFSTVWLAAVRSLPEIRALRVENEGSLAWSLVEPTDARVEAARVAEDLQIPIVCAGSYVDPIGMPPRPIPDSAALSKIGYAAFARAWLSHGSPDVRAELEATAFPVACEALERARAHQQVAVVVVLDRFRGLVDLLSRHSIPGADDGVVEPLVSRFRGTVSSVPVHKDSLGEVMTEPPFIAAAWEDARNGEPAPRYAPPAPSRPSGRLLAFPGKSGSERVESAAATGVGIRSTMSGPTPSASPPGKRRRHPLPSALTRSGLSVLLVEHSVRYSIREGGDEPTRQERFVLHKFARNQALVAGRLCPDLFELVVAARGAVSDRFARDLLQLATHWPHVDQPDHGSHLHAADFGSSAKHVTLRPKIDRLARRPGLARSWRQLGSVPGLEFSGICSHTVEDIVIEALGSDLRGRGGSRAARSGVQVLPFTASLLDGIDARETLRRWVVEQRLWVREESVSGATCGAVVVIFDHDTSPGDDDRFPWCEVWYGEHENESDMALYSTEPGEHEVLPGIFRAEYGGFLMIWPPRRLGDVWRDPAYTPYCRDKAERLLLAAADYSTEPIVTYVALRPPREAIRALARRLGRRIVHVPPGAISAETLRRVRRFHVLAGRELRPIAEKLIDSD